MIGPNFLGGTCQKIDFETFLWSTRQEVILLNRSLFRKKRFMPNEIALKKRFRFCDIYGVRNPNSLFIIF